MNNPNDPDNLFFRLLFPTRAGTSVSENTAVNSSVVWRAVTLLSGTIASLPLKTYRGLEPRGKEADKDHPLYYKLHHRPNDEISSFEWRIMGLTNQLLWGNWYNEIEFENHRPVNLWPLPPWRVTPKRSKNNVLFYEIKTPDHQSYQLPPYKILHVKNLYINGDEGMSCLRAGREAVGLGLAAEEFGARFFGSGANVGGIVEYPGKLKDDARENFINSVKEAYAGLGKSHRLMLLEEGLKYHRVGIPPNEAQFLETRKFQVAEIGRFFFITQLHKLGDLERATFSNIEEQGIDFVVDTIRPLLVNIEQEINYKLFPDNKNFAEFVVDGLLRGDSKARAEFYNRLFQVGGLSVNDILEKENMNPIGPEGNKRFVPMNMVPLDSVVDDYKPKSNGEPEPVDNNKRMEYRSGPSRTRISRSYQRIFKDAAARIIRREEADIMQAARKFIGERSRDDFIEWLETFYKKHPDYVKRQMLPAVSALAEAIQAEVAQEINIEAGMTPELEKFVDEYVESYTRGHVGSSQGQLNYVMEQAREAGEDEIEALQTRFDEWNERRPDKIARWETVQVNGAITRTVLAAAGITKLVVRNTGSKTCEFCESLDGVVVGIEQPIIPDGGVITGKDGSGNQLSVSGKKMNPPFHFACVCSLEAVRD